MARSKFSAKRMRVLLKQQERNISVKEICEREGISQATFYNWKKLLIQQQLKDENEKLRRKIQDYGLMISQKNTTDAKNKLHRPPIPTIAQSPEEKEEELLDLMATIIAEIIEKNLYGTSTEDESQ